jgi:hypothetical protein
MVIYSAIGAASTAVAEVVPRAFFGRNLICSPAAVL